MEITIKTKVATQAIADLMVTTIEGNYMTRAWCAGISPAGKTKEFAKHLELRHKAQWYSIADFYNGGFELMVYQKPDDGGDRLIPHRINAGTIKAGLERMAKQHPKHFADFISEDYDVITADVFLQCAVLKEVIYG